MLSKKMTVGDLLSRYPDAAEVFDWYGIDLASGDEDLTLAELAREFDIDIDDLLVDLDEVADPVPDEDGDEDYDGIDEEYDLEEVEDEPAWMPMKKKQRGYA